MHLDVTRNCDSSNWLRLLSENILRALPWIESAKQRDAKPGCHAYVVVVLVPGTDHVLVRMYLVLPVPVCKLPVQVPILYRTGLNGSVQSNTTSTYISLKKCTGTRASHHLASPHTAISKFHARLLDFGTLRGGKLLSLWTPLPPLLAQRKIGRQRQQKPPKHLLVNLPSYFCFPGIP